MTTNPLYLKKDKLYNCDEVIDTLYNSKDKSKILRTNYKDTIKQYGKSYNFSANIISQLLYEASWGDKNERLINIIDSLDKSINDFLKRIKSVASNVYPANIIYGPIKDNLVSTNYASNTWYNILKKCLNIAKRVNNIYIKDFEREKAKLIKLNEEKRQKEAVKEQVIKEEVEYIAENWEDLV